MPNDISSLDTLSGERLMHSGGFKAAGKESEGRRVAIIGSASSAHVSYWSK
jgi:cation diffusion facilitator CzcD-associated flavoprotein CzcO